MDKISGIAGAICARSDALFAALDEHIRDVKHVFRTMAGRMAKAGAAMAEIKQLKTAIAAARPDDLGRPEGMFVLFHRLDKIETNIAEICRIVNVSTSGAFDSDVTGSFISNMAEKYAAIMREHAAVRAATAAAMSDLISAAAAVIVLAPGAAALRELYEFYIQYPGATHIWAFILSGAMKSQDAATAAAAAELLEESKNSAMTAAAPGFVQSQLKLQRFGLIPVFQSLTAEQVIERMLSIIFRERAGARQGGADEHPVYAELRKISAIAMEKKIGLYAIIAITSAPVSYHYKQLTMRRQVERDRIAPTEGISTRMFSKFDTVRRVPAHGPPLFVHERMGDVGADRWFIVRSLDGRHFDIMAPHRFDMFASPHFVAKLERGASPRVATYFAVANKSIARHVGTPNDIQPGESSAIGAMVRDSIVRKTIRQYETLLDTPPPSLAALYAIFASVNVADIITAEIAAEAKEIMAAPPELRITLLYHLQKSADEYARTIREELAKSLLSEFTFREKTPLALRNVIMNMMRRIVTTAAEIVFNPKRDLFVHIELKNKILKAIIE